MKTLLFVTLILFVATSCTRVQMKNNESGFKSEKILPEPSLSEYAYSYSEYNPKFYNKFYLNLRLTLKNNMNQLFERYEIHPRLVLDYQNNFDKTINLATIYSKEPLSLGQSQDFNLLCSISEADSFNYDLLKFPARKVKLELEVLAFNSINLDLKKGGNNLFKFDLTNKWRDVEDFNQNPKFSGFEELEDNYMPQMAEGIVVCESWHKGIHENLAVMFEKDTANITKVKNRETIFDKSDVERWVQVDKRFNLYFDKLLPEFYSDISKSNLNKNEQFEKSWDEWIKFQKSWMESEMKLLNCVLNFFENFEKNGDKSELSFNYYKISKSLQNQKLNKQTSDLLKGVLRLVDKEYLLRNDNYINQNKDHTWSEITALLNECNKNHENARLFFDKAMNQLQAIN
jgi:hypothetical protein